MQRYTIRIVGCTDGATRTMLAETARQAADRARGQQDSWRRFLAPGFRVGACEVVAVADDDPNDTATSKWGR